MEGTLIFMWHFLYLRPKVKLTQSFIFRIWTVSSCRPNIHMISRCDVMWPVAVNTLFLYLWISYMYVLGAYGNEWVSIPGQSSQYRLFREEISYTRAMTNCGSLDSHLVFMETMTEMDAVYTHLSNGGDYTYWIGLIRESPLEVHSQWRWSSSLQQPILGEVLTVTNLAYDERLQENKDRVFVDQRLWKSEEKSASKAYMCEKEGSKTTQYPSSTEPTTSEKTSLLVSSSTESPQINIITLTTLGFMTSSTTRTGRTTTERTTTEVDTPAERTSTTIKQETTSDELVTESAVTSQEVVLTSSLGDKMSTEIPLVETGTRSFEEDLLATSKINVERSTVDDTTKINSIYPTRDLTSSTPITGYENLSDSDHTTNYKDKTTVPFNINQYLGEPVFKTDSSMFTQSDSHVSAIVIGTFGVLILIGVFLFICVLDLSTLQRDISLLTRNLNCRSAAGRDEDEDEDAGINRLKTSLERNDIKHKQSYV